MNAAISTKSFHIILYNFFYTRCASWMMRHSWRHAFVSSRTTHRRVTCGATYSPGTFISPVRAETLSSLSKQNEASFISRLHICRILSESLRNTLYFRLHSVLYRKKRLLENMQRLSRARSKYLPYPRILLDLLPQVFKASSYAVTSLLFMIFCPEGLLVTY